jgi:putative ABC transport system ATP-binding protein
LRPEIPAARCENLEKAYQGPTGAVHALRGVTARFPRAVLTAVAGPSGSGKSSMLRILAGMDHPTVGAVEIEGVRIERASWRRLRRLRRDKVGYVYQRPSDNFFPYLTVREHLQLAATSRRSPAIGVEELLEVLGIANRIDHLPSELSGGEQQRAAFAHVLASGARLVVADEPTAELDTHSSLGVLAAIRQLLGSGVTFVLATHDGTVIRAADELVELEHGLLRSKRRAPEPARLVEHPAGENVAVSIRRDRIPVLEARGVSKTYRRGPEIVHAVQDVSLTVSSSELVGLIGRSGSGKTTLLNVVAGWERPDAGSVKVAGRLVEGAPPSWSEIAVLPQRLGLMEELTIRENLEYPARLAGRLDQTRPLIDRLVDSLGLSALQDRYPKETSVGEQQRAALARALVLAPQLLVADEPSGHQDSGWRNRVFEALRRATEDGTACVAATHDEGAAGYLDRVLAMSDGRLEGETA